MKLKQSTAVTIIVGPFVDAVDAKTPETGITLGAADQAELLKAGGASTVDISGRTWTAITGADGYYHLSLSTSDTDTVGPGMIVIQDSSVCLPVFVPFEVREEVPFDELDGASAGGVAGALAAENLNLVYALVQDLHLSRVIKKFTAGTGSSASNVRVGSTDEASGYYDGATLVVQDDSDSGKLAARKVRLFNSTNGQFILEEDLPFTPEVGVDSCWVLSDHLGRLREFIGDAASANPFLGSFLDLQTNKDSSQTFSQGTDSLEAVSDRLPTALVGGRIDSDVGNIQTDAVDADALAADAVTEIQSGLATAAALATLQGDVTIIDANVDDILASTVMEEVTVLASPASTTTVVRTTSTKATNFYNGLALVVVNAAGVVSRRISSYSNTNGAFTLATALPYTPTSGNVCYVVARQPSSGTSTLVAQDVRDAMKLAPTAGSPAAGSVDDHLDDILADTAAMQPTIATNLDAAVSSRAAPGDAMTLTSGERLAVADAVLDELLSGHTTPGSLGQAITDILADTADMQPKMALVQKLLKNRMEINRSTGIMTLYDDDGTTPLLTAQTYEDETGAAPYNNDGTNPIHRRDALS